LVACNVHWLSSLAMLTGVLTIGPACKRWHGTLNWSKGDIYEVRVFFVNFLFSIFFFCYFFPFSSFIFFILITKRWPELRWFSWSAAGAYFRPDRHLPPPWSAPPLSTTTSAPTRAATPHHHLHPERRRCWILDVGGVADDFGERDEQRRRWSPEARPCRSPCSHPPRACSGRRARRWPPPSTASLGRSWPLRQASLSSNDVSRSSTPSSSSCALKESSREARFLANRLAPASRIGGGEDGGGCDLGKRGKKERREREGERTDK
jgi:hypothetical protein